MKGLNVRREIGGDKSWASWRNCGKYKDMGEALAEIPTSMEYRLKWLPPMETSNGEKEASIHPQSLQRRICLAYKMCSDKYESETEGPANQ